MENSYIKSLLAPRAKNTGGRKVWSIDLETVWLPFFTATNTEGHTAIPLDQLGAPLRLAYNQDGTVKFSLSGKPVIRVAKDISDAVRLVRENMAANLQSYANAVATENADGYGATARASAQAGKPIQDADARNLSDAIMAQALAQAEAVAEAEAPKNTKRERVAVPA
ncbi:MAG: hypothetical protein HYX84_02515 [Chloroflexi bacterium]|nr:hypothetical protein [Chloroflexota bacterium]